MAAGVEAGDLILFDMGTGQEVSRLHAHTGKTSSTILNCYLCTNHNFYAKFEVNGERKQDRLKKIVTECIEGRKM